MDPILLKTLHLAGVIALFTSLGATLLGGSGKKGASILHGISLLLILLMGFAMLGKPPMGKYWWMVKIGLWLFLGVAPVLAKRKVLPASIVLALSIAAAVTAAWLGLAKPF
jgi:asparagine N-glycosylation enzyme membrane subunit Stt3